MNGLVNSLMHAADPVRSTFGIVIMELCSRSIEKNSQELGSPLEKQFPVSRVVGPFPNGHENGLEMGGVIRTTYPPSPGMTLHEVGPVIFLVVPKFWPLD